MVENGQFIAAFLSLRKLVANGWVNVSASRSFNRDKRTFHCWRFLCLVVLLIHLYLPTVAAQTPAANVAGEAGAISGDNFAQRLDHTLLVERAPSNYPLPDTPKLIQNSAALLDRSNNGGSVEVLPTVRPMPSETRFNLRAAFWQTFGENLSFHVWRVATDPGTRWNLAHKPFFHDWFASYSGFDMHRWGDGDDFIVNNLGHPLEGAVFSRTFLQNSPRSQVPIGKNSRYWTSRLKGTAWAAVWSVQLEIGPISETSIGNEGGFSYVPNCGTDPSCSNNPKFKKPPTNNTGWTDFVVTPLGGLLWVVGEDILDKYVVVPVARDHRILGGRVLRSALEPTRSFAAIFAGKFPWDLPTSENDFSSSKSHMPPTFSSLETPPRKRFEFGAHYTSISLPVLSNSCPERVCRNNLSGIGTNLGVNFTRGIAFDSAVNFLPAQQGTRPMIEGLFGFRVGTRSEHVGVFAKLRPGFIYYENAQPVQRVEAQANLTRFAMDAGGIVEYYPNQSSILRFDVGTTLVRYLTNHPDPHVYAFGSLLSPQYIVTQGNFQISTSYLWRF